MRPRPLLHPGPLEPFDERDTVFARTRLRPGTEQYDAYYARKPELRAADDRTRAQHSLASAGTRRYRPGSGALVDATFDPPLRGSGFPVNTSWDGVSETVNAVKPLDEILHVNTVERADFVNRAKGMYTEEEQRAMDEFVEALNAWCEEVRGGA